MVCLLTRLWQKVRNIIICLFKEKLFCQKALKGYKINLILTLNFCQRSTFCHATSAADVDTYLRDFQFKVLNYITCTNVLLKKMRILDSDMCTFCNRFEEDIEHLFFHCPFSLSFWKDFEAFWNINMNEIINFSVQDIIVGISNEKSHLLNYCILVGKSTIFVFRAVYVSCVCVCKLSAKDCY